MLTSVINNLSLQNAVKTIGATTQHCQEHRDVANTKPHRIETRILVVLGTKLGLGTKLELKLSKFHLRQNWNLDVQNIR